MNKKEVQNVIKNYVDTKYPVKVKEYHTQLKHLKENQIKSVGDVTFVNDSLMWQDTKSNVELKLNELELKIYCRTLDLANRRDWRVPTYSEMITLINYKNMTPASISSIQHIIPLEYWTSSQSVLEEEKNWFVDFDYGFSGVSSTLTKYNIRCVRSLSKKEGRY